MLERNNVFPEEFLEEFERRFIRKKDSRTRAGGRQSRAKTRWNAAMQLIVSIGIEPSEWFYNQDLFYDYFFHKQLSASYACSILSLANLWGFFICRKLALPFLAISNPRGYERQRISEANFLKRKIHQKGSGPLTPKLLHKTRGELNTANYNWLNLSIWFGLRPLEIDNLKNKNFWNIERFPEGFLVLWVYQTKIISTPSEERWKPIPLLDNEQVKLLKVIESKNFKRPISKTMHLHFGEGVSLYGGRKGFVDLMLSKGHSIENISVWMGHSTIQRTWQDYKQRKIFHLKKLQSIA